MDKWDFMLEVELKKKTLDVHQFVMRCCYDLGVTSQQVIDNLLSIEDEDDVKNGNITEEVLRLHIELWITAGKPHYSGKKLG